MLQSDKESEMPYRIMEDLAGWQQEAKPTQSRGGAWWVLIYNVSSQSQVNIHGLW